MLPINYRPISIVPNLSKILEKSILAIIHEIIVNKNIIPDCQYGFRTKRPTKDAVLDLRLKLERNYNSNMKSCMILLDFSKAFDRVIYSKLIRKLDELNFPLNIIKMIQSFLENRKFCVKINDYKSNYLNTHLKKK